MFVKVYNSLSILDCKSIWEKFVKVWTNFVNLIENFKIF